MVSIPCPWWQDDIELGEMGGYKRKLPGQPGDVEGQGPWSGSLPMTVARNKFRKPRRATKQEHGHLRKHFCSSLHSRGEKGT